MDGSLAEEGIYLLYLLQYLDVTFSFAWSKDAFFFTAVMARNIKKEEHVEQHHKMLKTTAHTHVYFTLQGCSTYWPKRMYFTKMFILQLQVCQKKNSMPVL